MGERRVGPNGHRSTTGDHGRGGAWWRCKVRPRFRAEGEGGEDGEHHKLTLGTRRGRRGEGVDGDDEIEPAELGRVRAGRRCRPRGRRPRLDSIDQEVVDAAVELQVASASSGTAGIAGMVQRPDAGLAAVRRLGLGLQRRRGERGEGGEQQGASISTSGKGGAGDEERSGGHGGSAALCRPLSPTVAKREREGKEISRKTPWNF